MCNYLNRKSTRQ